ncbi:GNAT family N-acetyltransferase [Lysinibacillus xylanilyticus]|uniref:GNAT family N-acetyltransferase n=2 Tax=Lysinibacillus xylanilyticus TaxID=582475 RepID=A0ABT4EKV6_9BACI|nr:GNAT family N-acetyltransferase [Lysinibacillus xylanilyticus]MCY9546299.1 GNAT family N-acetyltransferase [Lysinibacillus xylanilyticus]
MKVVEKLLKEEDFIRFVDIVVGAYPGRMGGLQPTKEQLKALFMHNQNNDASIHYYGLWEENKLVGGMRLHDFEMNLFSKMIPIGGVGLVAVDLLRKKEKVAKELIDYFFKVFLEKNVHFVALYPFRPDFYKKMGFGYGPKMHQYSVEPSSFPKGATKKHLTFLTAQDQHKLADCYRRVASRKHGMFLKTESELASIFKNPQNYIIAAEKGDSIQGYMVFSFNKQSETNFLLNNLVIKEWIYETPEVLLEFSTFLNSQVDQVNRIEWNTQEENIHFFLGDVRNGTNHLIPSVYHASAVSGVGLMYRIINVQGFFEELTTHNFNGQTLTFKLTVKDSLLVENNQQIVIKAIDGNIKISNSTTYDVEMAIDITELSSLVMGVVTVQELFMLSKVKISDEQYVQSLHLFFLVLNKPTCITAF